MTRARKRGPGETAFEARRPTGCNSTLSLGCGAFRLPNDRFCDSDAGCERSLALNTDGPSEPFVEVCVSPADLGSADVRRVAMVRLRSAHGAAANRVM